MPSYEFAELLWNPDQTGATWYEPGGARQLPESGLQALQLATRKGWEVVGYGMMPRAYSKCLMRRVVT